MQAGGLGPARKTQARASPCRGAIAGDVLKPVEVEMLGGAGNADPVENLRAAGVKLVARQILQELGILVGAGLEDGAVEILVDQKVAQAT
jgi:hypothetical protein